MLEGIFRSLGTIIYPLFSFIFILIDLMQFIFGTFAGIESVYVNENFTTGHYVSGSEIEKFGQNDGTGIVFYMLTTDLVKNLFMSILLLAIFLLVIFTAMAIIKNIYASNPKNWKDIVASAFKGLANFIFIPVCCLLGIWLSNILLITINGATTSGGGTSISRQLFVCSAYNANQLRGNIITNLPSGNLPIDPRDGISNEEADNIQKFVDFYLKGNGNTKDGQLTITVEKGKDVEYYAQIIDQVYANTSISIYDHFIVGTCYQLIRINYILLAGGGAFILWVLFNISFGMVKRLFILLFLFVISPGLCAMYPLDDGEAVKKWKGDFVKNTISAYGAVIGMNLFFSLSPLIQNIQFQPAQNGTAGAWLATVVSYGAGLLPLLLTIAGLYVVSDLIGLINGYIGAGDALGDGSGLWGKAKKRYASVIGKTVKGTTKTVGAFTRAGYRGHMKREADKASKNGAKLFSGWGTFFKSLGGSARDAVDSLGTWDKTKKALDLNDDDLKILHPKDLVKGIKEEVDEMNIFKRSAEAAAADKGDEVDLRWRRYKNGVYDKEATQKALIQQAEQYGIKDKALKKMGLDPAAIKSNADLIKGLEDNKKAMERSLEGMEKILKDFGGTIQHYNQKQIDGTSSKKKRESMLRENEAYEKLQSLAKEFDDSRKALGNANSEFATKYQKTDNSTLDVGRIASQIALSSSSSRLTLDFDSSTSIADQLKQMRETLVGETTPSGTEDSEIVKALKEVQADNKETQNKIVQGLSKVADKISDDKGSGDKK